MIPEPTTELWLWLRTFWDTNIWPQTDEDAAQRMGDNWHQLSIALQASVDQGNAANTAAAAVWLDTDGEIFHDAVDGNLNQGYAEAVASYEDVAKMCWDLARTVAQTKDQIYSELIMNAVFFALTFLAPPGIGDLLRIRLLVSLGNRFAGMIRAAAGLMEHAAASAPRALGRVLGEMTWEGIEEAGTEILAQSIDMARGYREEFDGKQIAVAWGAGTIGDPLSRGLNRVGRIGRSPAVPPPNPSRGRLVLRQSGQTFVVNGISSPVSSVIAQSIADGNYANLVNPLVYGEAIVAGGLTAGTLGAGRIVSVHAGDVSGQFVNGHVRTALGMEQYSPPSTSPPGGGPNGPTPTVPDTPGVGAPGASATAPGTAAAAGSQLGGPTGAGSVGAGGSLAGAGQAGGGSGHLATTHGPGSGHGAVADPHAPHARQDIGGHGQGDHSEHGTRQNAEQNDASGHRELGDGVAEHVEEATAETPYEDVSGTDTHLDPAGNPTVDADVQPVSGHAEAAAPQGDTPGVTDLSNGADPAGQGATGVDVQSLDHSDVTQQNADQGGPVFVPQQPVVVADGGSHPSARAGTSARSGPPNGNSEVAVEADLGAEVTAGPAHTSVETSDVVVDNGTGVESAGSTETETETETVDAGSEVVDAGTESAVEQKLAVAETGGGGDRRNLLPVSEASSEGKAEPGSRMTVKQALREFAGGIGDAWGWTGPHAGTAPAADGNAAQLDDFVADGPVRDRQVVLPKIRAILASSGLRVFADVVSIGPVTVDPQSGGLLVEVRTTASADPVVLRFVVGPVPGGHPAEFHLTKGGPVGAVVTISERIKDADIGRAVVHELRELSHLGGARPDFTAHEQGRLGELLLMHDEAGRAVTDYAAQRAAYSAKMRAVVADAGLGRSNEDQRLESLGDKDRMAVRRALAFAADPTVMSAPVSEVAEESFGWFNENSPVVEEQDTGPTAEVTPWVPSGTPQNPDEMGPNWARWVIDKLTGAPRIAEARLFADFGDRPRPSADQHEREAATARGVGEPGAGKDEGGHAIAWRFFQKVAAVMNYFPQAESFNRGAFLSMENEVGAWLKNGWRVDLKVFFPPNEPRPSSVTVVYVVSDPADPDRGIWTAARTWDNSGVPHRAELTGPGGTRRPMPAGRPPGAQKQTKAQYQRFQKKRIDAFDPDRGNLFEPGQAPTGPVVPVVMGAGAAMAPDGSNQVKWSTEGPGEPSYLDLEIVKLRTAEGTAPFEWVIGRPLDSLMPDGIEFSAAELRAIEQQIAALVAEGTEVKLRFSLVENQPRVTVVANGRPVLLEQLPIAEAIHELRIHGVVDGVPELPALDPADPLWGRIAAELGFPKLAQFVDARWIQIAPDGRSLLLQPWIGDPVVVELRVGEVPDGHPAELRMRMGRRRAVVTISERIEFADVGRALVHELREAGHAFGGRPTEGQQFMRERPQDLGIRRAENDGRVDRLERQHDRIAVRRAAAATEAPTVPIPVDRPTVPTPVDPPTVKFVRGSVKSLLFLDGARRFFAAKEAVEYQAMLAMTDQRVWEAAGIAQVRWIGSNLYEVHTAQGETIQVILTADQLTNGTAGTFVTFLNGGAPATMTVSSRAPDSIVERIVANLLHQLSRAAEPAVPNVLEPGSEVRRPSRLSREDGGRLAEARLLNGRIGESRVYEAVRRMNLRNAMRALLESMAIVSGQEEAEYRRAALPRSVAPMIEWHLQGWSKHDDRVRLRVYLAREVTFSALPLTLGASAAIAIVSGNILQALGLALPALAAAAVNAFGQRWLDGEKKAVKGEASKLRLGEVRKRLPSLQDRIEADPHGVAGQPLGPIVRASLVPAGWRYVVKAATPSVAAMGTALLLSPLGVPVVGVIVAYSAMALLKPFTERYLDARKAESSIRRAVELEIRHVLDPTSYRSQLLEALDVLRARINGELAAAGSERGDRRPPWLGPDEFIGTELADRDPVVRSASGDQSVRSAGYGSDAAVRAAECLCGAGGLRSGQRRRRRTCRRRGRGDGPAPGRRRRHGGEQPLPEGHQRSAGGRTPCGVRRGARPARRTRRSRRTTAERRAAAGSAGGSDDGPAACPVVGARRTAAGPTER